MIETIALSIAILFFVGVLFYGAKTITWQIIITNNLWIEA